MSHTLESLVEGGAPLESLASFCDALDVDARAAEVRTLSRRSIPRLFELAHPPEGRAPQAQLGLLVPSDVPSGHSIAWSGKNSLPAFSRFSKRFTRSSEPSRVIGMNAQWSSFATGPGYFLAAVYADHPEEFVFDYTLAPDDAPPGWPAVHRNESGLGAIVYGHMVDHVRPIGQHVLVGAAFTTSGKPRHIYFALARGAVLPYGN